MYARLANYGLVNKDLVFLIKRLELEDALYARVSAEIS